MIALRGIVRQNEEKKWIWKGIWTFGSLPKDEDAALQAKNPSVRPFAYSWEEARNASDVLVPSANVKKEPQEKEEEESSNVAADSSTVMTDTETTQQTIEPNKEPPKNAEVTEASEKEAADGDGKSKSGDVMTMEVDESKEEAKEGDGDGENEKTTKTKPTDESKASIKDETTEKIAEEPTVDKVGKKEVSDKPEEYQKEPEKKDSVTFASTLPDEPPFTDACTKYPNQCPPGGEWKGYFETATSRKDKSTLQIPEIFCLFFNATPAKAARVLFPATDEDDGDESKEGASVVSSALLPPGYIHVRGSGSNQYGTWELIGSFNVETGVLQCQRMYVRMKEKKTPGRRGRPRKSEMKKKVSIGGDLETTPAFGPRSTRKRHLSWRKRASLSEDDEADAGSRRSSTGSGKRGRPRKSVDIPAQSAPFVSPMVTISIPPPSSIKRSPPMPSPRGPVKSAMTGPKKRAKASPPATSSSAVKLPRAGDPNEARWRAAHFLYYQRYDDATSDGEGAGGASNEGSDNFVVYEGEMSKGYCLREGRGVCLYNNGTLYEGEWKRNKEHGKGTLMTADRKHIIYEGDWERGRMQGTGVYYYFQDDTYASRRKNDGSEQRQCSRYEGEFRENTRHGNGKYFLPSGSIYDGEWREDVMSGRGTFTWPDGSVYIGSWKDGKRNGSGILQASDGFTYDGNWADNAMEGRGIATYPGGQRYEGLFTNGRREGRGSIHFANGAVYEGRFRDDCMEGQGTMKMTANAPIPRRSTVNEDEEAEEDDDEDWMIPISFQSDIRHIHQKAGFTVEGE